MTKTLRFERLLTLCQAAAQNAPIPFERSFNVMNAPGGPECRCGRPSVYEAGDCPSCRLSDRAEDLAAELSRLQNENEILQEYNTQGKLSYVSQRVATELLELLDTVYPDSTPHGNTLLAKTRAVCEEVQRLRRRENK